MLTPATYQPPDFEGVLQLSLGDLILRLVSRLDAFSVYLVHSWLPSCATGVTTGVLLECPSRSSRTKDRFSQISNARDR